VWGLRTLLYAAARTKGHVYLQGESGTGKELAARAIHQGSSRASGPYVAHNASNSTSSLLEWQLFGNLRNCPNQGMPARKGIVPSADGGTLFLDEIGDLPPDAQAQLLRVLDAGECTPVGGDVPQRVDVRFVAATNKPESVLRSDLPARFLVNVLVPPLRDRAEDIPLIARQWILEHARERPEEARRFIYAGPSGRPEVRISARLIEHLVREPPPLNVRGLHKLLWVAMQGSTGDKVRLPKAFPAAASTASMPSTPAAAPSAAPPGRTPPPSTQPPEQADSDSPSKEQILARLEMERGNVTRAAKALGLERSALYRRMRRYGIAQEEPEP
jgi:two-component system nitrogen regulation response regulator GlnG/two-component system response regulator HydG